MSSPPPIFPLPPSSPLISSLNPSMPIQYSLNHDSPSPYFSLPNLALLDDTDTYTPPPRSIKQIYGKVEHMSDRKQADFLLRLMAHSNIKPDFDAMAASIGLGNENAVKQRFKSLCEINKFKYEDEFNSLSATDDLPHFDKSTLEGWVDQGVDGHEEDIKPAAPKRKRVYQRKAKAEQAKIEDEDGEEISEAGPSKKPKATKDKTESKPAAKKAPKTAKSPIKTNKATKTTATMQKAASPKKPLSAERIIDSDEEIREIDALAAGEKGGAVETEGSDVDEIGAGTTAPDPDTSLAAAGPVAIDNEDVAVEMDTEKH